MLDGGMSNMYKFAIFYCNVIMLLMEYRYQDTNVDCTNYRLYFNNMID